MACGGAGLDSTRALRYKFPQQWRREKVPRKSHAAHGRRRMQWIWKR